MSTRRPSPEAYRQALAAAARMGDADADPHKIALSLLYLDTGAAQFEELLTVTDRFLRFGMPEHELAEMRQLMAGLRESRLATGDADQVEATLSI